jgi:hypothetical protein
MYSGIQTTPSLKQRCRIVKSIDAVAEFVKAALGFTDADGESELTFEHSPA